MEDEDGRRRWKTKTEDEDGRRRRKTRWKTKMEGANGRLKCRKWVEREKKRKEKVSFFEICFFKSIILKRQGGGRGDVEMELRFFSLSTFDFNGSFHNPRSQEFYFL